MAAALLARAGPAGAGWSFRGPGAAAAYGLMPAVYAAGWTALALRARGRRIWPAGGLLAGAVGTALAALDAALLPAFGRAADRRFGPFLLLALVAWAGAAPFLAARRHRREPAERVDLNRHLLAGGVWLLAATAGVAAIGLAAQT